MEKVGSTGVVYRGPNCCVLFPGKCMLFTTQRLEANSLATERRAESPLIGMPLISKCGAVIRGSHELKPTPLNFFVATIPKNQKTRVQNRQLDGYPLFSEITLPMLD